MKKIYFLVFVIVAYALLAASGGPGEIQNRERTGTPDGDNVCSQCHNSGSFDPQIGLVVTTAGFEIVTSYVPGETYMLAYGSQATNGNAVAFGFQSTALTNELDNAGVFSNPGTQVQLEVVDNAAVSNRNVVEHSSPSTLGVWQVEWTAPAAGTGDVTFYFSTVATNGSSSSAGDSWGGGTLVLSEDTDSNVSEAKADELNFISTDGELTFTSSNLEYLQQLEIYSVTGQKVFSTSNTALPLSVPNSELSSGINIITAHDGAKSYTFKAFVR